MLVLRILGAFLLFILVMASFGEYRDIRHGLASQSWPTTEAVVTTARAAHRTKRFEYSYQVAGRPYRSQRAGFALSPFHQEYRYHTVGDTIRVHYDPSAPERAVVRPGITAAGVAGGFAPILVLLAFGLYVAYHVRRGK
jgi:hypothetical protein